jgi:glycosyltransferase involved in cell wall biosynthesis
VKVGLNATCLNDRPSGAKQRFEGIYGSLVQRLPHVEFVVYEPADCRVADWFAGAPNVSARRTPLPSEGRLRLAWGTAYWPAKLKGEEFDVFECFNQPLVKAPTGRKITTIHDIRRVYAGWSLAERAMYRWSLRQTCAIADRVITVSEAMRSEILHFEPKARVSVVYNGLDPRLFSAVTEADMHAVRRKFGLPVDFVLAVGHFEPRKNYLRLLEAMTLLRDRKRVCNLVIVGNDNGARRLLEEQVVARGLSGHVKILSGLSDVEVRCAYKLSSLFVFPSLYEGFGIPILEAMAAGVPYVLSDIPVFREITAGNGVYFAPTDADAMAHAIDRVLSSESLRESLVSFGARRVLDFSFGNLAAQMADVYEQVTGTTRDAPALASQRSAQ